MLLEQIQNPADLRALNENQLPLVASELRREIIETVAKTGGHLGASLGVVDLTIALHYVFNTPDDRLIWDVGHQSYPHKFLTGRRKAMQSLRQRHGISGFTKREESVYDPFGTGHSSTSISAALGMAVAAQHMQQDRRAIAVIGDGAMSAGMAFEALNNAGQMDDLPLVVVLNDNEMSISPNVGALSAYFSRIMSGPVYTKFKGGTEKVLERIAHPLKVAAQKAEEHVKGMVTPGTLFEELGFTYFGPIDGHDFNQLLPTLRNIRELVGPILLHVITKKGRGFKPAEQNPCTYHGVSPFNEKTGEIIATSDKRPTYTTIFSDTLISLAQNNQKLVAITAAMPEGTGLQNFQERFPNRFFDVGIAEQHAVTFAAGLACEGLLPVVAIYSTFMQRAYDQLIHDVALQKLPVIFALDRAGLVGEDGPTHAGTFDLTFLRTIPEMVIMAPADENELRHMLITAVECGKPVAIRYPRGKALGLEVEPPQPLAIGTGKAMRENPGPITIIAVGSLVQPACAAADHLQYEGINVSVYDGRYIKPLDEPLLRRIVKDTQHLITLEENSIYGGFGAAVLEFLAREDLLSSDLKVHTWGIPDRFIPHGKQSLLRQELTLDDAGLIHNIRKLMQA
ncbi:1-deoxy-D-xylulose-5-phosphate synthase [Magnetococcales bacterium HHB-1]